MEITREEYEFLKSIVDRYEYTNSVDPIELMPVKEYFTTINNDISIRLYNCLKHGYIINGRNEWVEFHTMGELKNIPRWQLMKMRNFGKVCMKELEQQFKLLGWELKED